MLGFMRDRNMMLTTHVSLNMLLATFTLGISVFAYGFEGGVVNTIQAMPSTYLCFVLDTGRTAGCPRNLGVGRQRDGH